MKPNSIQKKKKITRKYSLCRGCEGKGVWKPCQLDSWEICPACDGTGKFIIEEIIEENKG